MPRSNTCVSQLLKEWPQEDTSARDRLLSMIYDELHCLAKAHFRRERKDHTLRPTELVHEAYLRLVEPAQRGWHDRAHFFAMASTTMRRILVDHARRRRAQKRGGQATVLAFQESRDGAVSKRPDIVALDEALKDLEALDERQARVVELRFFVGLSLEEVGAVLEISPATVKRDWTSAKAWLFHQLKES